MRKLIRKWSKIKLPINTTLKAISIINERKAFFKQRGKIVESASLEPTVIYTCFCRLCKILKWQLQASIKYKLRNQCSLDALRWVKPLGCTYFLGVWILSCKKEKDFQQILQILQICKFSVEKIRQWKSYSECQILLWALVNNVLIMSKLIYLLMDC